MHDDFSPDARTSLQPESHSRGIHAFQRGLSFAAAAGSTNHTPRLASCAGVAIGSHGPSSARETASALPAPAASIKRCRAARIGGGVSVSRSGGGFGPITGITRRLDSRSDSAPGKSDAVWPSSPIPSTSTSRDSGSRFRNRERPRRGRGSRPACDKSGTGGSAPDRAVIPSPSGNYYRGGPVKPRVRPRKRHELRAKVRADEHARTSCIARGVVPPARPSVTRPFSAASLTRTWATQSAARAGSSAVGSTRTSTPSVAFMKLSLKSLTLKIRARLPCPRA